MLTIRRLGEGEADTTDYSTLSDAACALIPACVAWKAAGGVSTAASGVVDESLVKAQEAATQVMSPAIAQLQRLERTITWAAVGTVVALAVATGTVVWVTMGKRHR